MLSQSYRRFGLGLQEHGHHGEAGQDLQAGLHYLVLGEGEG